VTPVEIEKAIRLAALHYIRVNKMTQKRFALNCGLSYKNFNNFLNNRGKIKCTTINAILAGMEIDSTPILDNLFMQIDENVKRKRV